MLEKIKSIFFTRNLLFLLDTKRKFELFRYNKNWQNFINVNLKHYKIVSRKYILYEDKEKKKGKEYLYLSAKIIFDGEYFQGKREGKGKEYDNKGGLIFEGEYSKGKRHGIGKEYNKNGILIFEGEYSKGKKWNGILKFQNKDFEIKNGKGIIKEFNDDNLIYEGEYLNGEKNGKCKLYINYNKLIFEGEYLNGKIWNGKFHINNNLYEIKNGNISIKEYNNEGSLIFSIEYLRGEKSGKWKLCDANGNIIFETNYLNDKKNGKSLEYNLGQKNFIGEYINDIRSRGREYKEGKLKYEGEYFYGIYWNGKEYDENDNIESEVNDGKLTKRFNLNDHQCILSVEPINDRINCKMQYLYNGNWSLLFEIEIIYEKYIKGKGYGINGRLLFEVESLNAGKNIKLKLYNTQNGVLIFDGEILDGKKNGRCKEYNKLTGKLIYEGLYIDGKRLEIYTAFELYIMLLILFKILF